MCLGIPMQIVEIDGVSAIAEVQGVQRTIGLQLLDNPQVGDYVIVHAGFGIQKVDDQEAEETLRLLEEYRITTQ